MFVSPFLFIFSEPPYFWSFFGFIMTILLSFYGRFSACVLRVHPSVFRSFNDIFTAQTTSSHIFLRSGPPYLCCIMAFLWPFLAHLLTTFYFWFQILYFFSTVFKAFKCIFWEVHLKALLTSIIFFPDFNWPLHSPNHSC